MNVRIRVLPVKERLIEDDKALFLWKGKTGQGPVYGESFLKRSFLTHRVYASKGK